VVRPRSAKPLFAGSIPAPALILFPCSSIENLEQSLRASAAECTKSVPPPQSLFAIFDLVFAIPAAFAYPAGSRLDVDPDVMVPALVEFLSRG
jgi:hypothetical protein